MELRQTLRETINECLNEMWQIFTEVSTVDQTEEIRKFIEAKDRADAALSNDVFTKK